MQFASGLRDLGRGFAALRAHPRLWAWVIAPAVITLVLLAAVVLGIRHVTEPVTGWLVAHLPESLARTASTVLGTLIGVALWIGAWIVFVPVAGMITGPFAEQLSENLEAELTGRPAPPFSWSAFLHGAVLGILHGVRRIAVSLVGLVLVLVIGFVPVVGTIAAVAIGIWFAATSAAYDCYDAVLARRSMAYGAKMAYLAGHRARTLGLGAAVAGALLVPGLNLIALGVGAAGATVAAHALQPVSSSV